MATARRKSAAKAAPVEEPEVEELELDEEETEVEETEEAPKAKKAAPKPAVEKIEFGSAWLAEHVNAEAGTSHTPYTLRILLRKLTKDGVLKREESAGRARYSFTGPKDPQVKAIVEAVKSGTDEKAKAERLEGLKEKRKANKKTTSKKAAKAEAAEPEAEEEEDFEDIEDI